MNFDFLFEPLEELDSLLTGLLRRRAAARSRSASRFAARAAPRVGPRPPRRGHVAGGRRGRRHAQGRAARAPGGASATPARCSCIGLPLIAFKAELPAWLETGAEKAIGVVILVLAARVIYKWARGDYRADAHAHDEGHGRRRHLRTRRARTGTSTCARRGQALAIGLLHGLAGTGAVVLLLIAALPASSRPPLALAVFAPMSIVSMAACTAAFAWVLTRPDRRALLPHRADPRPGPLRRDVRPLVRGLGLATRLIRPQRQRQDQQGPDVITPISPSATLRASVTCSERSSASTSSTPSSSRWATPGAHALADQRDEQRHDPVDHVQAVRGRGPRASSSRPTIACTTTVAWATRSSGQNVIAARALWRSQPDRAPPGGRRVGHQHGDSDRHVKPSQRVSFGTM